MAEAVLNEPILTAEDVRVWEGWRRTFKMHTRTLDYRRAVSQAMRIAASALEQSPTAAISWSGGKDSTAVTHLVRVGLGADVPAISEKDDLDYPGEETYVRELADAWGLRLTIVRPPVSPVGWLLERRGRLSAGEDMHSRSAGLSKACFYGVMEQANEGSALTVWGLRAEESGRRRSLLTAKGANYTLKSGMRRSAPLAFWTGLDVFTYLQEHGIEPMQVYRCCGWLPEHRRAPWMIRKSWWIPGAHAKHGQAAWLRRYWPSLYARLRDLMPDAQSYS